MIEAPLSIDVAELDRLRKTAQTLCVLDVREQWERDIAMIKDSIHIPLQSLKNRISEMPMDRQIVVLCHHGARSAQATAWLRQNGFPATNLEGGIDAWAGSIDQSVARY
jgi:rhodanese-related sulfurtransferase